jgi:23S rRNA (guanosine2251-2'-O)-methyltransferase
MPDQIIYGINPVLEALKADRSWVNKIIIAEGRQGTPLKRIQQLARQKGVPVQVRVKAVLTKLTGRENHQGVVGLLAGYPYSTLDDLLRASRSRPGRVCILVLDGIEDPQNLGSLIRTAEACGVTGVILPKDRAAGVTPAVVKVSAGAAVHTPVVRVTNLVNALEELKKEGFWIVGADSRAEKSLYAMRFDMNVGLVIGGEGRGIRPLVLEKCDFVVSIPMKGKISSLNAAVAGAVVLFEILRQQSGKEF